MSTRDRSARKIIPMPGQKTSDDVQQVRALLERLWQRVDADSQHDLMSMWQAMSRIEHIIIEACERGHAQAQLIEQLRQQRNAALRQHDNAIHRETSNTSFWRRRGDQIAHEQLVRQLADTLRADPDWVRAALYALREGQYTVDDIRALRAALGALADNL